MSDPPVGLGHRLGGRYELRQRLGSGGMADVYRAVDRVLDRTVAVKVLRPERVADPTVVERFRREARAASSLPRAHVVAVHDTGTDGDLHFLVLEYVEGPTLAEVLRDQGPLPPGRVVEITRQVGTALAAAHRRGLVHRDVKPSNILFDRQGRVRVTDFGLARAASDVTITTPDAALGSLPYLAPEQARGGEVDPRADVYALGCVVYEMLTGRPPFTADAPAAVLFHHLRTAPTPPSRHRPGLPRALDPAVLALLVKDPADRPGDMAAAVAALETGAAGQAPPGAPAPLERTAPLTAATGAPAAGGGADPGGTTPAPAGGRWRRWAAAGVLGAALLAGGLLLTPGQEAPREPGSAAPPAPTTSPSPTPEPSPTPSPAPPATDAPAALFSVLSALTDGVTAGELTEDAAEDIGDRVADALEKLRDGKPHEAHRKLDEARRRLAELAREGEISTQRRDLIAAALSAARQAVGSA